MSRSIIAVTADSLVEPSTEINENFADFAPRDLKEAIIAAGGIPVILPFPEDVALVDEFAATQLRLFDGLVLPGGSDIDPIFYGEEPIPALGRTLSQRDAYEIALVKATVAAKKPILAICRGLQLVNVALGGTLYQDLATQHSGKLLKHAQAAAGGSPTHQVRIEPESHLSSLLGGSSYVNSRHHQTAKAIAPGLTISARASDGVVEALERDNLLAVQWHPENMWQQYPQQLRLFEDLLRRSQRS